MPFFHFFFPQCPLQLWGSLISAVTVAVVTSSKAPWRSTVNAATATYRVWSHSSHPVYRIQVSFYDIFRDDVSKINNLFLN